MIQPHQSNNLIGSHFALATLAFSVLLKTRQAIPALGPMHFCFPICLDVLLLPAWLNPTSLDSAQTSPYHKSCPTTHIKCQSSDPLNCFVFFFITVIAT